MIGFSQGAIVALDMACRECSHYHLGSNVMVIFSSLLPKYLLQSTKLIDVVNKMLTHNVDKIFYSPRNFATMLHETRDSQLKVQRLSTPTLIHQGGWYEIIHLFGSTITQIDVVILFMKLAFLSFFLVERKKRNVIMNKRLLFFPNLLF